MSEIKKNRIYPYFDGKKYYNYKGEKRHAKFWPSLFMLLKSKIFKNKSDVNLNDWYVQSSIVQRSQELVITWLGHASFLIQVNNINIITDPLFNDLPLFPRLIPSPIALDNLPLIDFVLLSHNHRDHLDKKSLNYLKKSKNIVILVPKGDRNILLKHGFNNVKEYNWWDYELLSNIKFTFLPAYHWSGRHLFDQNYSLWGSWMISYISHDTYKNIYFAGDTAFWSHFEEISNEFKTIDIAMMPIGPCEPRKFMFKSHINSEEAIEAFKILNATYFIPMHWGTYSFGLDSFLLPYERLIYGWEKEKRWDKYLETFKIGESKTFSFYSKEKGALSPSTSTNISI